MYDDGSDAWIDTVFKLPVLRKYRKQFEHWYFDEIGEVKLWLWLMVGSFVLAGAVIGYVLAKIGF
jgi:hypothetical protein